LCIVHSSSDDWVQLYIKQYVMQAPVMGGISGPDSPTLGAGDLHNAKCRLGLAYELLPKYLKQTSLFGGSEKTATLAEVEVYFSPEIAALY
jgi:hypothetical protein